MFKPINADDDLNTIDMEKVSKMTFLFLKVISCLARISLTLIAIFFALASVAALISSLIEKDFMSLIGMAACAFIAFVCWTVKKEIQ